MSAPRPITRTAALIASVAVALVGCRGKTAATETVAADVPAVTLTPDNIASVERRQLSTGPSISGSLAAARQAALRAEVAGVVTETLVEPGQAVKSGQLLVRLDDSAIRDAVLSARSAARTANEAVVVAKRNAERSERLAQAGALAERDLEQARWQVMNADAALADANARLSNATKQLDKTSVVAPFAGIVSERPANRGDVLQLGNPIVTVVDPRSLRLEATVPASALGVLKVGSPVDFEVSGFEGKSFRGRVERINPSVDPATRQVRLYAEIPNTAGPLVAGLFAQGRVATEQRVTAAVPFTAVDQKGTGPIVRRLRSGKVEIVAVTLGLRDEVLQMVEITSGLVPGDTVLVGPSAGLAAGTPVRIIKE